MVNKTVIKGGTYSFIVAVLTASVYLMIAGHVRIDVGKFSTEFSVWENEQWTLGATERFRLKDGSSNMLADNRTVLNYTTDKEIVFKRTVYWHESLASKLKCELSSLFHARSCKSDIWTEQFYYFDLNASRIEEVPAREYVVCHNCGGKIVEFEYKDIEFLGNGTQDVESILHLGHNMAIWWQEGAYLSKFYDYKYAKDKVVIRYKANPAITGETFYIRMYDPQVYEDAALEDAYYDEGDVRDGSQTTLIVDNFDDVDGEGGCVKFANNIPAGATLDSMILTVRSQDGSNEALQIIYSSNQTWPEELLDTGTLAQYYSRMNLTSDNVIGVYYGNDVANEYLYFNLTGAVMQKAINKGPANLTFCFNNTGDVADQYAFVTKEGSSTHVTDMHLTSDYTLATVPSQLWINKSHPSCSDSYTRLQATNKSTPWCRPTELDKIASGDTVNITGGEYYGTYLVDYLEIDLNTTIQAHKNENVRFWRIKDGYNSTGNGLWTSDGGDLWHSTMSSSTNTPRVYFLNMSHKFFAWYGQSEFLASDIDVYPYSSWYNGSVMYIRVNGSQNPNNMALAIAHDYNTLRFEYNDISPTAYIIVKGITFMPSIYGPDVRHQNNIVFDHVNVTGPYNGMHWFGYGDAHSGNITVRNSFFNGLVEQTWYQADIKDAGGGGTEETSAILAENVTGAMYVINNNFTRWGGAISLTTDSQYDGDGSVVAGNHMTYGRQSQMEIEDYCYNSVWYDNVVDTHTTFACASFATAKAINCEFHHNICYLPDSILEDATHTYKTYCVKFQNQSNGGLYDNVQGWDIYNNFFYCDGRVFNVVDNTEETFDNNNFTRNIMASESEFIIRMSGEAADGVHYDYNDYWNAGAAKFAVRWNDDSDLTEFSTLAAALASGNNPGTWDANSRWGSVSFVDLAGGDYRPSLGEEVCTMSSEGSYIGALPCETPAVGGILSYWALDGDLTDYYNLHNGTNSGASTVTYGKIGGAYSFDGSTSDIIVSDTPALQIHVPMTISLWFKPDSEFNTSASGDMELLRKGNGYLTRLENSIGSTRSFYFIDSTARYASSTDTPINAGEWYHILSVWNGSHINGYLNGVKASSTSYSGGTLTGDSVDLYFGSNSGNNNFFDGSLDEIAIYNQSTDDTGALLLYHCGLFNITYPFCTQEAVDAANSSISLYVNKSHPSCSDSYTRLEISAGNPLCNVSAVGSIVNSNDHVYLATDNIWFSQSLNLVNVENIKIDKYGSGTIPKIEGRGYLPDYTNTSKWVEVQSNIWRYNNTITATIVRLWIDDEYPMAKTYKVINSSDRWNYNTTSDYLHVYSIGNPAIIYTDIMKNDGVVETVGLFNSSYINITNLNITGGKYAIKVENSSHIKVRNSSVGYGSQWGIYSRSIFDKEYGESHNEYDNLYMDSGSDFHNLYKDANEEAITLRGGSYKNNISNCFIKNWEHVAIYLEGIGQSKSWYHRIFNNNITAPDIVYGKPFGTEGQLDNCTNNEIYDNYIYDVVGRVQLNGNENSFYRNIVDDVVNTPTGSALGFGINLERDGTDANHLFSFNNTIINNTFMNTDEACIGLINDQIGYNTIHNNILYNCGRASDRGTAYEGKAIYVYNHGSVGNNSWENNMMYNPGGSSADDIVLYYGFERTVTEFNTLENPYGTGDHTANNTYEYPIILNNYKPAVNSPACDASQTGDLIGALECSAGYSCQYIGDVILDGDSVDCSGKQFNVTGSAQVRLINGATLTYGSKYVRGDTGAGLYKDASSSEVIG